MIRLFFLYTLLSIVLSQDTWFIPFESISTIWIKVDKSDPPVLSRPPLPHPCFFHFVELFDPPPTSLLKLLQLFRSKQQLAWKESKISRRYNCISLAKFILFIFWQRIVVWSVMSLILYKIIRVKNPFFLEFKDLCDALRDLVSFAEF